MPAVDEECTKDPCGYLDVFRGHHLPVGPVLHPAASSPQHPGSRSVRRAVAGRDLVHALLHPRSPRALLPVPAVPHYRVLLVHLDQSLAPTHPGRKQAHGHHGSKVQAQGSQNDAGRGGDLRHVMATALHHLHEDQAGQPSRGRHRGVEPHANTHPRGPVAWGVQQLHQPSTVRLLQPKVQEGLCGHH